jgi:ATP-binding cassette subfamily B protein
MLAQYWEIPFRREVIRRILTENTGSNGSPSLHLFAAIAEILGLTTQFVDVPASALTRVQAPAVQPS